MAVDADLGDERLDVVEPLLAPEPVDEPDGDRLAVQVVVVAVEQVHLEQAEGLVLVDRRPAPERRRPGWTAPSGRTNQAA